MLNCRTILNSGLVIALSTFSLCAAEPMTQVSVAGMHCPACAKKIAGKVQAMPGIAVASADAKSGLVSITPKPQVKMSPKSLWETIEVAGYKPVKLVGPNGTFTEKPKE